MPSSSLAQRLPMLILSKIFGYLPTHTYFFGHGRFFASMCRSWREACLACIFKSIEVNTEAKSLATAALKFGYGDLVKHARIDFSSEDIFEGLALTVLTSGPFKDGVFPFVMKLESSIETRSSIIAEDTSGFAENGRKFCAEIHRMFPATAFINTMFLGHFFDINGRFAEDILHRLTQGVQYLYVHGADLSTLSNIFPNACSLQGIDTRLFDLTPYHIEIVQRNAPVLQRLRVVLDRPETFRQLVLRGDGTPIVFPCLRTLKMNSPESTAAAQSSVDASPSGAIFPELELLYLNMRYPFENDVLFRGNRNSPRFLKMLVSEQILSMLAHFDVFAERLTALSQVRLDVSSFDNVPISSRNAVYVLNELCAVPTVFLNSEFMCTLDVSQLNFDGVIPRVTVLNACSLSCTVEHLVMLIKSLPRLRTLIVSCLGSAALQVDSDQLHTSCTGHCHVAASEPKPGRGNRTMAELLAAAERRTRRGQDKVIQFLDAHVEYVFQTMSDAGIQLANGPPISQNLVDLDVIIDSPGSHLQYFRFVIIFALLCPTVQHFRFQSFGNNQLLPRSEIVSFQEFKRFVSGLDRSMLL